MKIPDHPLRFQDRDAWQAWLQDQHATHKKAWLVIKKNRITDPGVFYTEAVEEALCFGWIDGVMRSATNEFYFLRFSPRRRGSIWSASNRKRVGHLIAQGKMTEAGLAKVREAQENGEWGAAIFREDTSSLPDDLKRALERNGAVQVNFEKLPASQKKQFLYWILSAKTEKTRQKRIRETVALAANDKRLGKM
jgi:uncharacterized protein YdeI (YjbR/CyaY-like superfamily)